MVKKGVFSVLLFLLAAVSIAGLAGAMAAREKALSDGVASAVEGKRLFYAARDIESSFWKSVKFGFSNCADKDVGEFESCVKSKPNLAEWKKYAENYWLKDAKFEVFAGRLSDDVARTDGVEWDSLLSITKLTKKISLPSGMTVMVYYLKAAIINSNDANGIFVRIEGRDASTYAMMMNGESYACVHAVNADDAPKLLENVVALPEPLCPSG